MKQFITLMLCCIVTCSLAQKAPMKWGKVTEEETNFTVVPYDSTANAVILCEQGTGTANAYDGVTMTRHVRIKVLTDDAKEVANRAVLFRNKENITNYQAHTINMVDGKIFKIKLSKKDFFEVKRNENFSELRFTFPDVNTGSILEFSYTIESKNYFSLDFWAFQHSLPTLKSYYKVYLGQGLNYSIMYQGPRLINKYLNKSTNAWELENLPAIKDEPFCPNPFDYTEQINFQLAGYVGSGGYVDVMKTWSALADDFYDEGGQRFFLKKNKDSRKIIESITNKDDAPLDKVKKIYAYVTKNYDWNGKYSLWPDSKFNAFLESKQGLSSEINLYFVNLLQTAGLDALPAMISTKNHGIVNKDIVFYTQFNHLIAHVKIDGKDLLMDATDQFHPYNQLDPQNLNGEALVLNRKAPFWVPIIPNKSNKIIKLFTVEMPEPGILSYQYEFNARGYNGAEVRSDINEFNNDYKKYFKDELVRKNLEIEIDDIQSKDIDQPEKAVYLSAKVKDKSSCVTNDDYIYINPFFDYYESANPFNDKERYLPIDFYHPFEETYILNFIVPEGYEIVEIPENSNVMTEGNKGIFKFNSSKKDNQVSLRMTFAIKKPLFTPYEYPLLREIFDRYLEKREEQIVLRKKV